jgi:hypothetical protein
MATQLTIKNYRCFASPVTVELSKGFTAFVGVNNAGKSALMRFLVEMRQLFGILQDPNVLMQSLSQSPISFTALHVTDPQEIFSNLNTYGMEFSFDFTPNHDDSVANEPAKIAFKVDRNLLCYLEIYLINGTVISRSETRPTDLKDHTSLHLQSGEIVDLSELMQITRVLSSTLYVGPFRNAINIGAREDYFDIMVGDSFIKKFRQLKTGSSKRESTGIQELTDNIRKIFEFEILEIFIGRRHIAAHKCQWEAV